MSRPLRLLKFDSAHPVDFLLRRHALEAEKIAGLDLDAYRAWLMDLQIGLSDFLTRPMNDAGWTADEVFAGDPVYVEKLSGPNLTHFGAASRHVASLTLKQAATLDWSAGYARRRREWILEKHVRDFRPDVILIREPSHVDGDFFNRFRDHCLIASMIACNTNHAVNWSEHRSDVIFTLTAEYEAFFRVQGIESHRFDYGVDRRVAEGVLGLSKVYDCTFVGYLGQATQTRKSELFEKVAARVGFKWWGVKGPEMARYPRLQASWQGEAAGREMFRIYKQSRLVLNDYVDMAAGQAVNLRIKEVLGVGTMLLTRAAPNLAALHGEGALATFHTAEECAEKAEYFLAHEAEREAMAAKGLEVALRDFNYRDIAGRFMKVLAEAHERKRPRLTGWS